MIASVKYISIILVALFATYNCEAANLKDEHLTLTTIAIPIASTISTDNTTIIVPPDATTLAPVTTSTTITQAPINTSTHTAPITTSTTNVTDPTTSVPNTTSVTTTTSIFTTTSVPSTTTAPPVPCHRFDVPSFIGGIVLTLGLLAIALVADKFYKARNERNYHTL